MEAFDRTAFEAFKAEDHINDYAYWKQKSTDERLHAACLLIAQAYGFDPYNPPKVDRTVFEVRKHS